MVADLAFFAIRALQSALDSQGGHRWTVSVAYSEEQPDRTGHEPPDDRIDTAEHPGDGIRWPG